MAQANNAIYCGKVHRKCALSQLFCPISDRVWYLFYIFVLKTQNALISACHTLCRVLQYLRVMKILYRLSRIVLLCFLTLSVQAAKVHPDPIRVVQPDGTTLTVYAHGDEHYHWYTATDGTLLVRIQHHFYVARTDARQGLVATSLIAHEPQLRTPAEQAAILTQDRQAFATYAGAQRLKSMQRIDIAGDRAYFPHSGTPHALVVLVEFADTLFSVADPVRTFNQYLNGTAPLENYGNAEHRNYGSVQQYFSDMSFGQFVPQFDVVGPVKMPQPLAYYGSDNGNYKDVKVVEMMQQACRMVDSEVDFAQYDSNNDGLVDLVYFIYAGYAQSYTQNDSTTIWPKAGTATIGTFDGKSVRRYGLNNELIGFPGAFSSAPLKRVNGIGLFCHEFSHTLGLPDFYPTVRSAQIDNQGMEMWDLMDGGEYVDNGWTPIAYTPWERETMGWLRTDTLSTPQHVELRPIVDGGKAYKVLTDNSDEYLILENIQRKDWHSKAPGHGMLVYRVNYPYSTVNMGDNPNNTPGRPAMTIAPADGLLASSYTTPSKEYLAGHASDPYPGTKNVTEISQLQLNRSTLTDKPIYNISEQEGVVRFSFIDPNATSIRQTHLPHSGTDAYYTPDGRYVGSDPTRLPAGLYINRGKKLLVK